MRKAVRWTARAALLLLGLEVGLRCAGAAWTAWTDRRAGRDAVFLCVGDSWTEGTSAPGGGYPARLAARTGAKVVNLGRSGSNSTAVLAAVREGLRAHRPRAVLVLAGNNDHWNLDGVDAGRYAGWRGRARAAALSLRTLRLAFLLLDRAPGGGAASGAIDREAHRRLVAENLTAIVRAVRAAGAVPVLGTYFHRHGWGVNEIVREVARAEGVPLADHQARFQALPVEAQGALLVPDGHPNEAGYALMAEVWAEVLGRSGLGR